MSDAAKLQQALELYAQKQPDNPLLDICFSLLNLVHKLQHDVDVLRAENKSLRRELRRLNDAQKTPRERVNQASIQPAFESIRQEILQAITAHDKPPSIEASATEAENPSTTPLTENDPSLQTGIAPDPKVATGSESGSGKQTPSSASDDDEAKSRRRPTGRRKIPEHLPCEVITAMPEHLPANARFIRFEVSHRLGYRRGGLYRLEIRRAIFSLAHEGDRSTPPSAAASLTTTSMSPDNESTDEAQAGCKVVMPPRLEELVIKGLPTPDLLSYVVHSKFGLHLPLNRIEGETERMGFRVARATLSGWLLQLHPWIERLCKAWQCEGFAKAHYVATDATTVKMLAKGRCKVGYFWTAITGGLYTFYYFTEKHNKITVDELFGDFKGTILADGATVFNILFDSDDIESEDIVRAGCWAHCRRYFVKALFTGGDLALQAVGFINLLFEFERDMDGLKADARLEMRQRMSQPVIDRLAKWRHENASKVAQGSELARAFTYLENQWDRLCVFLRDGAIPISNNDSERSLRRLVVGRLNWLFVGHKQAGQAAATYASVIATCQMHRVDSAEYLRDLFRILPYWPQDRYLELAPHRWHATRARISAEHLSWPLGPLPIPPKVDSED